MDEMSALLTNAIQHHRGGQLQAAEELYRQILERNPDQPDAIHLLGVIAHQTGQHEESIKYIRRAIALNGETADACCNLGIAYQALQKFCEAIACYHRALELKWDDVETHLNLGVALKSIGRKEEALTSYFQALEFDPSCVQALNNIGIELKDRGQFDEALTYFHRALDLQPDFAEVHNNLGNALKELGRLDEAIACYRQAIALKPDYVDAHNNLGNPLKDQGQLDAAIASFRRAIELAPDHAIAHSNLVYTLNFSPEIDGPELLRELQCWNERHALPLANATVRSDRVRGTERRLRIGYVSPDFRDHCQTFFTVPLFANHNRRQFEIFCYSDVIRPDLLTKRLRSSVDHWREITGLNDENVAQRIRDDQIDILVDLTMHMAQNRLLVFARRPAPVQVSWLAYPGSTGMTAIDYRVTDPHLDPPGLNDHHYSERSLRLPETFWCYDPLDEVTEVNGLPATKNGHITFGCLNNFCKVNSLVLETWSRVLTAVENSRMMILAGEGDHRRELVERLEAQGISRDRLLLVPLQPRSLYLRNYHEIDLCLDTFPYNGHTTSLDSLWMGVPVITLVSHRVVGRAGLSQLMNLQFTEFVARTLDQFVSIAVTVARDLPKLNQLRSGLRERMRRSALMDGPRFAGHLEAVYWQIWNRWQQDEIETAIDGNPVEH